MQSITDSGEALWMLGFGQFIDYSKDTVELAYFDDLTLLHAIYHLKVVKHYGC